MHQDTTSAPTGAPDTHDTWACPTGFDSARLHEAVVAMYEKVARSPRPGAFHFHVGANYAVQQLGYSAAELAELPAACTDRFAGVGNPLLAGPVTEGTVVLDHACGSGTDLLLAARRLGPNGRAIGVDITPGMRTAAQEASRTMAMDVPVEILPGSFDQLPMANGSVDLVLSNGVLNLAPDKLRVLREAWRVLRPGGALYLADVVLGRPLAAPSRSNAALWAACVGGAMTEAALLDAMVHVGFLVPRIAARHDPFSGTSLPWKFGNDIQVASVTLSAHKPV